MVSDIKIIYKKGNLNNFYAYYYQINEVKKGIKNIQKNFLPRSVISFVFYILNLREANLLSIHALALKTGATHYHAH